MATIAAAPILKSAADVTPLVAPFSSPHHHHHHHHHHHRHHPQHHSHGHEISYTNSRSSMESMETRNRKYSTSASSAFSVDSSPTSSPSSASSSSSVSSSSSSSCDSFSMGQTLDETVMLCDATLSDRAASSGTSAAESIDAQHRRSMRLALASLESDQYQALSRLLLKHFSVTRQRRDSGGIVSAPSSPVPDDYCEEDPHTWPTNWLAQAPAMILEPDRYLVSKPALNAYQRSLIRRISLKYESLVEHYLHQLLAIRASNTQQHSAYQREQQQQLQQSWASSPISNKTTESPIQRSSSQEFKNSDSGYYNSIQRRQEPANSSASHRAAGTRSQQQQQPQQAHKLPIQQKHRITSASAPAAPTGVTSYYQQKPLTLGIKSLSWEDSITNTILAESTAQTLFQNQQQQQQQHNHMLDNSSGIFSIRCQQPSITSSSSQNATNVANSDTGITENGYSVSSSSPGIPLTRSQSYRQLEIEKLTTSFYPMNVGHEGVAPTMGSVSSQTPKSVSSNNNNTNNSTPLSPSSSSPSSPSSTPPTNTSPSTPSSPTSNSSASSQTSVHRSGSKLTRLPSLQLNKWSTKMKVYLRKNN